MTDVKAMDIRIHKSDDGTRRDRAARSAYLFLRRQVEVEGFVDKGEFAAKMWDRYFSMQALGLLVAPYRTRALLRKKLAYWTAVGVERVAV